MNRLILCAALAMPMASLPLLSGCEREVATDSEVDIKDDGTVVKEETTVTEDADGALTKEETKTVDRPETGNTGETTVKEETKTID